MTNNVFTQLPKRGDIVVKDFATKTPQYIIQDTFVKAELNTSVYEIVGVVYWTNGKKVGVVYKDNAPHPYCNRAWWYLSGYTLDGAQHTGVISARFASNSWATNLDKTITYNASDMEGLVAALNAAFLADDDFLSQDWYADIFDGKVRVHCNNIDYRQCANNSAKSGFTLTGSCPEIIAKADIRRKHGGNGGEGAISSWHRALAYYRNDNGKDSYMGGRTSVQTSIKQGYPINLPTWLGTSTKNPGDFCAPLRAIYGEGEEGWLKFMKSCLPVMPTDFGNMGMHNGKERTAQLASFEFTSSEVAEATPMCKASAYCYNIQSQTVEMGEFWLSTTEELARILDGVEYGTKSDRNADALNKGLNLIGGSPVSNGSLWWSCLRCYSHYAWYASGNYGFFFINNMYVSYGCAPVSLYTLRSNA